MYPKFLQPTDIELFIVNGKTTEVPKCEVTFDKWVGEPVKETFGGKPIVAFNNRPMFAELAIMEHFIADNWQARWVETYGKSKTSPIHLSEWKDDKYRNQIHNPITDTNILKLLDGVSKRNDNNHHGCWDVLGWKGDRFIFAELKRTKKDSIRSTQTNWLTAGLNYGLNLNNFLIVQWDFL